MGAKVLIDIVMRGAGTASAQMSKLGGVFGTSGKQLSKFAKIGVGAVAVALAGITKGVMASVQAFTKFEDKMTQSLAIMETTTAQQQQMARVARDVATQTIIGASESAEAYFFLASAGLNAEQSMQALPQVARFAQAGMFDMATATDLATDAQSALGLTVKDAQQNLMNLTRVTDVLVRANTLANATVQQFSEALTNKAGAALKMTNKSIEEGVAVLAAFADRGVKGAEAGEKMNQILRDVSRAVHNNTNEWKQSGITVTDATGNLLNLADVVKNLSEGMDGLSDVQKAALLDQLGLNRGVADAVKILAGSEEAIRNYQNELENAMGYTERVAKKQLESFTSQMKILNNQSENLKITIGEAVVPSLVKMVKGLQTTVERLQNFRNRLNSAESSMKKFKIALGAIMVVLGVMFPVITAVAVAIGLITKKVNKGNKAYEEASKKADQYTEAHRRQQYYLGFTAEKTEEVIEKSKTLDDILDGTNFTVDELTKQLELNGIALDENAQEALKTAEAYEDSLLGGMESVLNAMEALEDRQERIHKAETRRNKALEKQTKAEEEVKTATDKLEKAKEKLNEVQGLGAKITDEEALAIARQKQVVEELTATEDKSEIQKLELAVAINQLNKLEEESIALSREEEDAIRQLEQAEKDLVKAEERKAEAIKKVQEEQKKLNKLTEASLKNTLEYAILQENLNKALEGFGKGTKGYNDALAKMSALTGVTVNEMIAMYDSLFASMSRTGISAPSVTTTPSGDSTFGDGVNPAGAPAGNVINNLGQQFMKDIGRSSVISGHGGRVGSRDLGGGQTLITVNTGNLLGSTQEVQNAVASALKEAQRRGIEVAL